MNFVEAGITLVFLIFAVISPGWEKSYADETAFSRFRRERNIPYPGDNPFSSEKAYLGKVLFFDPRLSSSNLVSCAGCHNPASGWTDGLPRGLGHNLEIQQRHTPTILNLAWSPLLFWDGRADSLEDQAGLPIQATGEMHLPISQLVAKLQKIKGYQPLFEKAFGSAEISFEKVKKALSTFERTVVSGESRFDRWVDGRKGEMTPSAILGFNLFTHKAGCFQCHSGWRFTDDSFHDIGLSDKDMGRGVVLGMPALNHTFKTPTLRDLKKRAPYFHDGSARDLSAVLEFYNRGGDVRRSTLSEHIKPLGLNDADRKCLLEFLESLDGGSQKIPEVILPK